MGHGVGFVSICISLILSISSLQAFAATAGSPKAVWRLPAAKIRREARLNHAQELLGKYYNKSAVKSGEKVRKINRLVYKWVHDNMPKDQRHKHKQIAKAIIEESAKHGMDPVFLMSVMQGESGLDPMRLGTLDEIGLMQLRPSTAQWIAEKFKIKYTGPQSLFDPTVNVRLGAAYLAYLREKFDSHAQLYLAAYNMGARNVNNALEKKVWPKDYPVHVMKYYVDFYSTIEGKDASKS